MAVLHKRGKTWSIDYRLAGKRYRKAVGRSKELAILWKRQIVDPDDSINSIKKLLVTKLERVDSDMITLSRSLILLAVLNSYPNPPKVVGRARSESRGFHKSTLANKKKPKNHEWAEGISQEVKPDCYLLLPVNNERF